MTKHSNYTYYYWVKPIAGRPGICSGFTKLLFQESSRQTDQKLRDRGYLRLTEEQAREWQYAPASGEMRSVVSDKKEIRMYIESIRGGEQWVWKFDDETGWRDKPQGKTAIIEEATRILGYRPVVTEEKGR